ncbi:FecR family protein [Sphingobacterium paludis]|uniref:FecR family protein n=1 Tax=Sphingobacterium paludis TaxID=1476465 RepID=A0A4R7CRA7_9SPHI|nr:FecR family protein [Sphingobacterium paludis]TDS08908.1 FecR family protein [Sphingobacterium paludis]
MNIDRDILNRYNRGETTDNETNLVEDWFNRLGEENVPDDNELEKRLKSLDRRIKPQKTLNRTIYQWGAAAIVIILSSFFAIFFYQRNAGANVHYDNIAQIKAPDLTGAMLRVGPSTHINFDGWKLYDTVTVDGILITKIGQNKIAYLKDSHIRNDVDYYHSITVPRGGVFYVKLMDGSSVWINSDSELQYYVRNQDLNRKIHLNGEAYFEVNSLLLGERRVPFQVIGEAGEINVLGTKFNAKFMDGISSALLEGKISLVDHRAGSNTAKNRDSSIILSDNQVYDGKNVFTDSDVNRYISWKDDEFDLTDLNLQEFSKILSTWYGISIRLEQDVPATKLVGKVDRRKDLASILKMVGQIIPIHYELRDDVIWISKQR